MTPTAKDNIFTPALKKKANRIVARYETKRAAILEVLRLIQETYGYVSTEAEEATADYLEITPIDVHEVVSFYTLFYRKPKAKVRFNVCRTLSCTLLGGEDLLQRLAQGLGVKVDARDGGGPCSVQTVECLGACELAPMLQLNDDAYFGPLSEEKVDELIKKYRAPEHPSTRVPEH